MHHARCPVTSELPPADPFRKSGLLPLQDRLLAALDVVAEGDLLLLRGHLLPRHLAALRGLEFGRGLGQLRVIAGGLRRRVSTSQVP